jgi:hypothetical protein
MKLISNLLPIIAALAMLPRIQGAKHGISSCTDVSCSVDGPDDTCTLAKDTFPGIGVVDVKNIPPILPQVSVIKGVTVTDPVFEYDGLNEYVTPTGYAISNGYKSVYYLGTPASVDVPSLSRCVVLFHGAHEGLRLFDGHLEESHGVCEDIIDDRCASDLKDLADSASKESQPCSALRRMLTGAHFDTCGNFAGVGRGLGRYTVTDLADLEPITVQQNKKSNCWPIVLKTSNLFHVASDIVSVSFKAYTSIIAKRLTWHRATR